jgi:ribosomal protein S14
MRLKIRTDRVRRLKFSNIEINRLVSKYVTRLLLNDSFLKVNGFELKRIRFLLASKGVLNSVSKTKIVRRCILTGRGRVSYRFFNISRIKFRELLKSDESFNIKKYSW